MILFLSQTVYSAACIRDSVRHLPQSIQLFREISEKLSDDLNYIAALLKRVVSSSTQDLDLLDSVIGSQTELISENWIFFFFRWILMLAWKRTASLSNQTSILPLMRVWRNTHLDLLCCDLRGLHAVVFAFPFSEKRRMMGLSDFLTDVARRELEQLDSRISSCCVIYIPLVSDLIKLKIFSAHIFPC